ncbi:MAG: hypothetical protein ACOYMA_19685 [Bacteroidia bacterium]
MKIREKQKIRGLRRRKVEFDKLIKSSLFLDLEYLNIHKYNYQKMYVFPWSNYSSNLKLPKGFRNQIAIGLIEIFNSWKKELDKMNKPYYLKIWLYYPRIINSQVVCAIGDRIEHYNNLFPIAENNSIFPIKHFQFAKHKIEKLEWKPFFDEETFYESLYHKELYSNIEEYNTDQKELDKIRNNHDRKFVYENDTCYCINKGIIWCNI